MSATLVGDAAAFTLSPSATGFNSVRSGETGAFLATGVPALFQLSLQASGATFALGASGANIRASLLLHVTGESFQTSATPISLHFLAPFPDKGNYTSLAASDPSPPANPYGGSDPSYPSFLRPYYVRFNSINKSRDLGSTEILIADFDGVVGGQSGSHTLFFQITLPRELDLRVVQRSSGASTDRYIRVGMLDGERRPIPLNARGYGYRNDIHNTPVDESMARLPAGTYFITVSNDQWQSLPYALTIFVGSYALLLGEALGQLLGQGRLPLIKPRGTLLGTAPLLATALDPDVVKPLATGSLLGTQAEFLAAGTYSWTAPAGVTSVSAVCVGGGGGGGDGWANAAGSGGGLGWKNAIPVTPGQSYTVVVGAAGTRSGLTAGGNSYFISLVTVAGYGGGNASSGADTNGPNKNVFGGGWVGDGGGAGGNAANWTGGGGAGGYSGTGGNAYVNGAGGGGGGGIPYSSTYGTGSGGGTGLLGQGANGLTGRSRDGTLWSGASVAGFGGSGGSTAVSLLGAVSGTGGRQGETASYGQQFYGASIVGGFPGGGGGGPGTSYGGGNGGGGAVRLIWGNAQSFPFAAGDLPDPALLSGGLATPTLTLTIMRGVALGQLDLIGRLKQTWRLTGIAQGSATAFGTLSSQQQGGGYGY